MLMAVGIFGIGVNMVGPTLLLRGSEEQKQRFLTPLLRGQEVWCQLFSEPSAGSDLASLRTSAAPVEGGWRLTGQKVWTTNARDADFGLLLARTDPTAPKHAGPHHVPAADAPAGRERAADQGHERRPALQ